MRIAIVEDDKDQALWLRTWLTEGGYDCHLYLDGNSAIKALQRESFDLVLLDWMLPDINGDKVLGWIRENIDWHMPVIFATQRGAEEDIAFALEHGADDYVTKPIKPLELRARMFALTRRLNGGPDQKHLVFGAYDFDLERHRLVYQGQPLDLTQKEFELALFLYKHADRLLSRSHLLESVWGHAAELNTRTLDTHISRLRKKLQFGKEGGWQLSAVYHQGYRLESPPEEGG